MANKFAFGLIAAGLASAIGVNLYQAADRGRYVATTQAEAMEYAPAPEVAAPAPAEAVVAADAGVDDCQHYLRAAASYMKAAQFDESRSEIEKAEQAGCPTDVPLY